MRKTLLTFCLMAVFYFAHAQEYSVNGYIKDGNNGETLIGATAFIPSLGKGVTSNEYGFYSLTLPQGEYIIEFSYLGFETLSKTVSLTQNTKLDIEMGLDANELQEIVVTAEAEDNNVTDIQMSVEKLDIQTIKSMPALLGEVEIIRSLQLLPGVTSVGEGATGFNVRGGSIDQNLVLLDEAPVYNSSHLFGFFSVFNPDAVKDVKLYKGGIPSRYGGRLSSILDVRMKEGNSKNLEINGGIGLIFSRLSVEAPIIKDKASFIVAGRRSYIDILAGPFLNEDFEDTVLNFYDLTAKANYNINDKNRLFVSGYFGRDNFGFGNAAGFNWGNTTISTRWNHLFSEKLFSNITFYYSDYDYQLKFGEDSFNRFDWNANIQNWSIKPELSYFLNPNNLIRFGGQSIVYKFEPGSAVGISEGESQDISLDDQYALENALYLENEQNLDNGIKLNYGIRYSHFNYTGEGTVYEYAEGIPGEAKFPISSESFDQWESIKEYGRFEPRFSITYPLTASSSLKASYNRTAQYIHLLSNTTASTPVDVWTPSTRNIRPSMADQVALGYFQNFKDNTYEFSTEVYYKKMEDLIDYIDGADLLLNPFLEGAILSGKGRAYGWELQLKKNKGKFSGWLSYTLARSERQVIGINNDQWYPSRFDQKHNLSITGFYEINDRWSLSANFVYLSGTPATFPNERYEIGGYIVPHNSDRSRNSFRIPDYHRLDLSATWKGKKKSESDRWDGEWVFSVYNVYSKKNPFAIYFRQGDTVPFGEVQNTEAAQLSVIGNFIPSVSYNFKFNK